MNDNSVIFNKNKCIKCTKCVTKCNAIGIDHICMKGEGKERYIDFIQENPCIKCGQCTLVCPVDSMCEKSNIEDVKKLLEDKDKVVVVQSAPSVRASINELFKMEYNTDMEKKLNTCYRILGFDKVFDVNFGADITSMVEAEELMERLYDKNSIMPMFTSCCPSWVNFVKYYRAELLPNLTTAMSPHIHSGMSYKTWWAKNEGIESNKIAIVSIMPCTAKKEEIYEYNGIKAVDYVLTVRELGKLIVEKNIDFINLEDSEPDSLSEYSGGAVIYGNSGGVMESALRIIKRRLDNSDLESLNTNEVKINNATFREATIDIGNFNLRIAIISTPKNFRNFIDSGEYKNYSYIEVMSCNGGCINGGGQPLLPTKQNSELELIQKRSNVLKDIDKIKIKKRNALDNINVNEYLSWVNQQSFGHSLLHIEHHI